MVSRVQIFSDLFSLLIQGYELAEDEVKISLERFRLQYTNDDGSPK